MAITVSSQSTIPCKKEGINIMTKGVVTAITEDLVFAEINMVSAVRKRLPMYPQSRVNTHACQKVMLYRDFQTRSWTTQLPPSKPR